MKSKHHRQFFKAKCCVQLTTGDVIRMLRELKDWTQADLAARCKISPTNLSALENNRVDIGKKRATQLAEAFNVHPAIIMFPEYEGEAIANAA